MVELRDITKQFGNFTAVYDVNLTVNAGEFMTFLGPSGCGKTTLLRMISGFETPTQGQVLLDGTDVTHIPPYHRDVNQVFQSYALFPHLNVWDNIAFGLRMKEVSREQIRERVEAAVAMVALGGFEYRKPLQLSGGQRQRVALARAIVNRPKVLLLDEPLSALDAKLRHSMQIELKRLQKQLGITFIFVTHDQEEALTMSDRIAVFNQGRIEQLGTAAEIYHRPTTAFVAQFIGLANLIEANVSGFENGRATINLNGGIQLTASSSQAIDGKRVLLSIRPEKLRVTHARQEGDSGFPAVVEEVLFKGALEQLELQANGGLELTAVLTNQTADQRDIATGDKVWCQVHPDDIAIVEAT
jgi:spermidine/putrescine transport system ATP-binding protein